MGVCTYISIYIYIDRYSFSGSFIFFYFILYWSMVDNNVVLF